MLATMYFLFASSVEFTLARVSLYGSLVVPPSTLELPEE